MSQQGERHGHDSWWQELYDERERDTGPAEAADSLDDRFASAARAVGEPLDEPPDGRRNAPGPPETGGGTPPEPPADPRPPRAEPGLPGEAPPTAAGGRGVSGAAPPPAFGPAGVGVGRDEAEAPPGGHGPRFGRAAASEEAAPEQWSERPGPPDRHWVGEPRSGTGRRPPPGAVPVPDKWWRGEPPAADPAGEPRGGVPAPRPGRRPQPPAPVTGAAARSAPGAQEAGKGRRMRSMTPDRAPWEPPLGAGAPSPPAVTPRGADEGSGRSGPGGGEPDRVRPAGVAGPGTGSDERGRGGTVPQDGAPGGRPGTGESRSPGPGGGFGAAGGAGGMPPSGGAGSGGSAGAGRPAVAAEFVGDRPPTYEGEPTALPVAGPDDVGDLVPDTVLDGARYRTLALRAASVRGDSARFRGEPRRDALLTARFGAGDEALLLVAVATGVRAAEGAHRAAADACRWAAAAVGRSHARLAADIRAGRRGELKSGLHRLTDRAYGRLRARAHDLGRDPAEYTARLRCLLLPADPECRTRVFFGVGEGGLFRLRDGGWQDIEPSVRDEPPAGAPVVGFGSVPASAHGEQGEHGEPGAGAGDRLTIDLGPVAGAVRRPGGPGAGPEPCAEPFRFRASIARPGDTLLLCSPGLAAPVRGEPELARLLAERWAPHAPPGTAEFLADVQLRAKGYADDRTAAAVWEA